MNWFEELTGFRERGYEGTRARLRVEGERLVSTVNAASYGIGAFSLPSLGALREEVRALALPAGRLRASITSGDARELHRRAEHEGSLFQVASQFNMLEMVGPHVTPEQGVAIYEHDHTQGPACAIAAGAATIFRNYFVPHAGGIGQTAERQINGSAALRDALAERTDMPPARLWTMRNGYAEFKREGLSVIEKSLTGADETQRDALRATLVVGLHENVEVTDHPEMPGQRASQVFCSALPVAYNGHIRELGLWRGLASLVLEATYEAAIWAAVRQFAGGGSNRVLLTSVGGGAFGNERAWIVDAMRRALRLARNVPLDVRFVAYRQPEPEMVGLLAEFE